MVNIRGFSLVFAAALLLLGVFISIPVGVQSVGVCYGMIGNDLPSKSDVVQLYKSNGITDMRIYLPDVEAMNALRGTGIGLIVGVANDILIDLAANPASAASWVDANVKPFVPAVNIKYIAVGNEISGEPTQNILPVMQNINAALAAASITGVKASTAVKLDVVTNTFPPSAGVFAAPYMTAVAKLLGEHRRAAARQHLPLLRLHRQQEGHQPQLRHVPGRHDGARPQHRPGLHQPVRRMVDSVYAALDKAGAAGVSIVVSESGWPSAGGDSATIDIARTYVQNLIKHAKKGTPKRPGVIETYVFAMFNENQKPGEATEQNFGAFYPNKTAVYPINFQ
ncbi:hypothetical protein OsJ_04731 [Oryza sativa Japonica Group]|uniref:Uncharacterized protein n=1 Tax=Oryza sativa subsp. japonica TaxID=39947 RepID=A3A1F7_ORYSJ|nr:hypothetical protein OsJ_04731 [Oryza sativa Japonica Group]